VLGVVGALLTVCAFALLGTASGSSGNWLLLWAVMALATLPVQATIWTSAVATRFDASRGLAFAVTLCGASVAAALFPYLGSRLIAAYGWRTAFSVEAGLWIVVAFPLIFLFFRGANDATRGEPALAPEPAVVLAGTTLGEGLRSSIYLRLWFASLLFTFTIIALVVHFVPILAGTGRSPTEAAGIAALIGLCSIVGRLATGLLLDRFRGSLVGGTVFLLPVAACLLLATIASSPAGAIGAAALIGLTLGAEIDVIVFLTTKHFGLRSFGALYGGLLAALSLGTAAGPLGASWIFDLYGSYNPFLWSTMALMVASSAALFSLPRPAFDHPRT
ncbi:MAG: MFS transporter, partial [Novosphingobium sp.]